MDGRWRRRDVENREDEDEARDDVSPTFGCRGPCREVRPPVAVMLSGCGP
jgi:hypothetical protein